MPDGLDDELASAVDGAALVRFFEEYKDAKHDKIDVEGMQRFCDDLGVDPSDPVMLVLAWRLNATTMCEFGRKGPHRTAPRAANASSALREQRAACALA